MRRKPILVVRRSNIRNHGFPENGNRLDDFSPSRSSNHLDLRLNKDILTTLRGSHNARRFCGWIRIV
ncbi:hypothetical protein HZH66_013641 [Vespula vulgaris]|uniref:Uncharacterized protein n=1 Tax=Vespula vulgaris TaxID=7454 RepID=A0A834J5K2_VESVU|nr:hypothetical protein HZH66_013641 [Vespula vulgaris]